MQIVSFDDLYWVSAVVLPFAFARLLPVRFNASTANSLEKLSVVLAVIFSTNLICLFILKKGSFSHPNNFRFICMPAIIAIAGIVSVLGMSDVKKILNDLLTDRLTQIFLRKKALLITFLGYLLVSTVMLSCDLAVNIETRAVTLVLFDSLLSKNIFFPIGLFVSAIIAIIAEEVVFRYFAVNALSSRFKVFGTVFWSAVIWTLFHRGIHLDIFILGVFLGYFYVANGSLFQAILLHTIYNLYVELRDLVSVYNETGFHVMGLGYMLGITVIGVVAVYILGVVGTGFALKKVRL